VDRVELGQMLASEPLGWDNIERFLKARYRNGRGPNGCFAVNSMRESAILPRPAIDLLTQGNRALKELISRNIEAERPQANRDLLADLILTVFTGLRMEQNVNPSYASVVRRVDEFMKLVRK
jgi:TetR/AcrR family transcriptional regulator, copper-responsive repressor